MLRVQGLPATLTAFITSMAVLFQSAMTSARTGVLAEIRAKPTIAAFSTFIVASFEKLDSERLPMCQCGVNVPPYSSCHAQPASAPRHAKASLTYQGSIIIFAK